MPRLIGGGGGGGSSTVSTDGVTIQGDGSTGNKIRILQVETQARITGAGTVASPLDIAGWPLTSWRQTETLNDTQTLTANKLQLYANPLPAAITFSNISFFISVADGTNNNDVGLYNSAGTLVANAGAQHMAATGLRTFAVLQAPVTIPPGLYFFAVTSAAGTLAYFDNSLGIGLYYNATFGASAGGALPASITAPALAPSRNTPQFLLT